MKVLGLQWMDQADPGKLVAQLGITFPTFRGDGLAEVYGAPELGIPLTFVIGPDGHLLDYSTGYHGDASDRRLRRIVDQALSGR